MGFACSRPLRVANQLLRIRQDWFRHDSKFVGGDSRRYCIGTMTATAHQTLRAIVVVNDTINTSTQPTCRLLSDLGHDVVGTASPDEVINLLQESGADLLVVDLPTVDQKRRLFERLAALPRELKPRRVAVFADEADEYTKTLHRQHDNARVHVFIKPLHVHGLLNVLRSIEGRNLATA